MSSAAVPGEEGAPPSALPPVTEVSVAALLLVVIGGIDLASHLPAHVSLGLPFALLAVAGLLLAANVILLSRVRIFAWRTFFRVAGWALLAYVVIAGMLEYIFLYDHTSGGALAVLSLSLLVYAVDIPLLLAFSVARYQPPD